MLLLALGGAVAALAQTLPAARGVITGIHCRVTPPKPLSHRASGLTIVFTNSGPTIVHGVTFGVAYRTPGGLVERTVDDAGIFAPNTTIEHHFATFSDVPYAGPAIASCRVTALRSTGS